MTFIIIIIINEEKIRMTLSHRDVAGALYIIGYEERRCRANCLRN